MSRDFTHGHVCPCDDCVLDRSFHQTHISRVTPNSALPASIVSLQELVTESRTPQPVYEVGEDWNDD
jgi:hypothetical protein